MRMLPGLLALALILPLVEVRGADAPDEATVQRARAVLDSLVREDFAAASKDFDASLRKLQSPDNLRATWKEWTDKLGAFKAVTDKQAEVTRSKRVLITFSCEFARGNLDCRVVQDSDGKVTGLGFFPAEPKVKAVSVPFIFWGGDVATFEANGGFETTPTSTFGKQGLKLTLTPGDNFDQQVKDYLAGKTPFLRGTLSMIGQYADQLTAKPETTPVVFLQLTWSAGDHLVGRASFKTLNDLKGKKIALQKGGPHVGMLNDILRTTKLKWSDVRVVWTDDVSGDKGPADLFRKDATVDGCFAVTPDMSDLTGGLDSTGDGKGKSVKDARVVVSTAHMSRSIADVYACRKDFFEKNRAFVERFAAGYLKSCEELVAAKKKAGGMWATAPEGKRYREIIKMAQDVWCKDAAFKDLVAKAEDVDGLISDASFVGLPGNETFFTRKGNLSGFAFKMKMAVSLPSDPATQPLRVGAAELPSAALDYAALRKLGDLHGKPITQARIKAESKPDPAQKIYDFEIRFDVNQSDFPEARYGEDFQRALEAASLFGNSLVAVRGHADPGWMLDGFAEGGLATKLLTKVGDKKYKVKDGATLDLNDPKDCPKVHELIVKNDLSFNNDGTRMACKAAVKFLDDLSTRRAAEVRKTVVRYAEGKGLLLEKSQIREQGVGSREPRICYPRNLEETKVNRRVEFSIIKVPAADVLSDEFEL